MIFMEIYSTNVLDTLAIFLNIYNLFNLIFMHNYNSHRNQNVIIKKCFTTNIINLSMG